MDLIVFRNFISVSQKYDKSDDYARLFSTCCFSNSFVDYGLFSQINRQNNNLILICFLTGAFVTYIQ